MATHEQLEQWVNQRMTVTDSPAEWPDIAAARTDLDSRIASRPQYRWVWAAATVAVGALMVTLPSTAVVAQRFWDQVVLGRIQVLISDDPEDGALAASVFSPEMQHSVEMHAVPSIDAASNEAGFSPHVPAADVFSTSPAYSVANVSSATLPLRTSAIRTVVARAGGSASDVPETWNGVVLEVRAGPVIIADYGGTLLLQSLPFQLIKPVDFDLERFYRLAFRSLGMSEREAALLAADLEVSPAMLTFMPKEDRKLIHEFATRTGTGMMIEEVYGSGKVAAVWSGANRVYALFGPVTSDFVTKVANALE